MNNWLKERWEALSERFAEAAISDPSPRSTALWLGAKGVTLIVWGLAASALGLTVVTTPFSQSRAFATLFLSLGSFTAIIGVAMILLGAFGVVFTQVDKVRINIVAWRGYADPSILNKLPPRIDPLTIEYVRGVSRVETLLVRHEPIGVLISDAEFLHEHHQGEYIDAVRPKPRYEDKTDLGKGLEPPFKHDAPQMQYIRVKSHNDAKPRMLGVPIRWAINDIVFNHKKASEANFAEDPQDYSDFHLSTVLSVTDELNCGGAQYKIGLWNWFHPTLQTLLLCEDESIGVPHVHLVRADSNDGATDIKQVTKVIKENADRFVLLDDSTQVREQLLQSHGCWIVYGAGSWALTLDQLGHNDLSIVVPNRGVTSWVECLSFPHRGLDSNKMRPQFVDAFLQTNMQVALCESSEYLSAPVGAEAMAELLAKQTNVANEGVNPYLHHLRRHGIINDEDDIEAHRFIPRRLAEDWHLWDAFWRDAVSAIRQSVE